MRPAVSCCTLLFCLFLDAAAPGGITASARIAQETGALSKDALIDRQITGGEIHAYRLSMAADHYFRARVEQRNMDVFVRVIGPDGRPLLEARDLLNTAGTERIVFLSEATGDHRLEVHALGDRTFHGGYVLRIEEWRPALPADKDHAAAARNFKEAQRLHAQGTAESRPAARARYEEVLPLFRAANDKPGEADTLQYLGQIHFSMGEPRKALEYMNEALGAYRAAGDRHGEALIYRASGLINHSLGEWEQAVELYARALPLSRELENKWEEAGTLNNLGGVYMYVDEPQLAMDYYSQSLALHRALGNQRGEAVTLNNLGEIHRLLADFDEARKNLERSLELRRAIKDARGEAITLHNLGLVYDALGDSAKALALFNQALPLRRTVGDLLGEAATLGAIGHHHFTRGDFPKAMEYLSQALPIQQKIGHRQSESSSRVNLGAVHASLGDAARAMEQYGEALRLSRATGYKVVEAAALYQIARLERDRGNLPEAKAGIEAAIAIVETLRSRLANRELRTTYFASRQNYYEFHADLLMRMNKNEPGAGHAAAAFEAKERALARSLLDTLAEARADIRRWADSALLDRERKLQQRINAREQLRVQLLAGRPKPEGVAAVEKELSALLGDFREVRARIRQSSPRYAALMQPQPLGVSEIRRQMLDEETILLEYALGEARSHVWVVTKSRLTGIELPKREEIESAARRVYDLLTARNRRVDGETPQGRRLRIARADADYASAAAALSRMVLGPAASELRQPGKRRLLIVSDGALQYIPFSALPMPSSGEGARSFTPLIAEHEIVSLPSASTLAALRREAGKRGTSEPLLAVLADPVFEADDPRVAGQTKGQSFPSNRDAPAAVVERSARAAGVNRFLRLRFTRAEADAITSLVPEGRKLSALDFSASRATLERTDLSRYRFVHFATHGLLNSQHPELSGIVLSLVDDRGQSQDGFLRLHEIYNLKLNADLVVLSGCQTALGKEIKGEGLVGLTRGFMYAGAKGVMASLWSVEDKATAELMKSFYNGALKADLPAPAALRAAQRAMLKDRRWAHPYYWAAFTFQGDWK
ncbi:MAG: CHAT domain-containing tetratricopeptide repeat protein [Blastocatellia bacterium]